MAFRGRGRGRGYGGSFGYSKQEKFELFPDIELPKIPTLTKEQETLVIEQRKLENFWKTSPYFLEEFASKESIFSDSFHKKKSDDIERYSDRKRPNNRIVRDSLSQYLVATRFPQELVEDSKGQRPSRKKARWNLDSELNKLDVLEKLEQMAKGGEDGEDKKGDGDEDENEEEEVVESSDTDGEYTQNIDFDDDEDDFIDADNDGGDDEGIY
ncbi:uncharacterized protein LOC132163630 [Corylus avellana]|uniref:uncharacterized protein LOC132163630 n=1 Tax=Corylus avellana TaxID=13451 RepID=UPI001E22444B|nr:uncharacterized protein LOC132163630 [Corylus avellana]XP_059429977.1 uncharacterized protein LOC132163630 [Corylus avellana]XP_059429978.1 uncharacterized protein LOC132163630 [Corylus avellana]